MELALRQIGHTLVVAFVGRVNLEGESAGEFKERFKGLIADGHIQIVLDMGNVGFVDSEGLGTLISGLKVLRQVEGSLVLTSLSEPVEAVLRLTRLQRVFEIVATVDDALHILGARTATVGRG
jgi:anti-sigma B factor antagonist